MSIKIIQFHYMLLKNDWKKAKKAPYTAYNPNTGKEIRQMGIWASTYMAAIVGGIGVQLHWNAYDFVPNELSEWATYQSYLSSLFGWTSNIPRRKIIVFIRNRNQLYVMERGRETGNINLNEYKWFNYPTYTRKQLRTTWMKPTDIPYTGTAIRGLHYIFPGKPPDDEPGEDASSDYGSSMEEVPRHNGIGADNRLTYTKKVNPDGSVTETNYEYLENNRNYFLKRIHEVTKKETSVDPVTGITIQGYKTTRDTVYSYLQGGIKHTDVYVNNIKVEESEEEGDGAEETNDTATSAEETNDTATSVERIRTGDESNEFLDDHANLAYGGSWKTTGSSTNSSFLNASDAPVLDSGTRAMYWAEMEWMDRAIEETATLTITAPVKKGVIAEVDNHLFDFFDTYTLNGNVYYLESNSVSLTTRSLKQELTLIRWYK